MKAFLSKHSSKLFWLGAGLLIMFLFMRSCGGREQAAEYKQEKAKADSLQQKVIRDSISHSEDAKYFSNTLISAASQVAAAKADVKAIDKKLTASTSKINQLVSNLQHLKNQPEDSSFVKVHPRYAEDCDSLAVAATIQQGEINEARREIQETAELMNYEIALRDTALQKEQNYSAGLRADFNAQAVILKTALNMAKPRGRLLGGVGLIGNETNPLGGNKINIAYQSKGGKQYQIGGILMRGGVWYEATVLVTLIK